MYWIVSENVTIYNEDRSNVGNYENVFVTDKEIYSLALDEDGESLELEYAIKDDWTKKDLDEHLADLDSRNTTEPFHYDVSIYEYFTKKIDEKLYNKYKQVLTDYQTMYYHLHY